MPKPPAAVRSEARKALEWRRQFGRGGTPVGVARARDPSLKKVFSMIGRKNRQGIAVVATHDD